VTFDFPIADWSFAATLTEFPDVPHAKHSEGVDVAQPVSGRFVITPPTDTGDFQVALTGTGPQGTFQGSFRWRLSNNVGGQPAASCVGPFLGDHPPGDRRAAPSPSIRPGESLELRGHFYMRTCNDTGQDRPLVALPDVRLTVTFPNGGTVQFGPFTPGGRDMGFTATIHVPVDAGAGTATVTDDLDYPRTFEFQIRR
jgi:hypothetical protein